MARTEEDRARSREHNRKSLQKKRDEKAARGTITYASWVIPLVGDPIQIGPFKSKHVTLKARYRIVKKLVAEKNARDFDIRLLGMYENGQLEDSE